MSPRLYLKHSFLVTLGLVATFNLGQNVQAQAPAANILTNGGTEDGSDKTITGWSFTAGDVAAENLDYGASSQAMEGKQSFHIALTKPVQANVWWVQEATIPAGTKSLQISCRTKRQTDMVRTRYAVPSLSCYFSDGKNTWMGWQSVQDVPESSEWITLKRNVAVPAGAVRIGIRLGVQSQGVVDTYFDDVAAVPNPSYLDIVGNGDIETTAGEAVPGWTFQKKLGTETQLAFGLSQDAAAGKHALRIASTDAEVHGYWAQVVPLTAGIANYQLSLCAKLGQTSGAKSADATVGYAFLDEKLKQLGFLTFGLITDKNWNDYTTVASPPPDAKYIEIRLALDGMGQTEAFFDEIKMLPSP